MAKQQPIGENGLRIVSFTAENIKKLVAVEITPSGGIVTIAGKNGAGKSSIIDAIAWAIGGTAGIQSQPIRKGQTKARIKLDLGEIIVERRFNEKGSQLVVESAEGARFPSPQKMLDDFIGALSFDPHAFLRMDAKKQADELRRVSQIEIDIDVLDGRNKADFDKRTDINRDARAKRAAAEAIIVANGLPDTPLDESALVDQIQSAGEHNAQLEQRKGRREQAKADATRLTQEASELQRQATQAREDADAVFKRAGEEALAAYEKAKRDAGDALTRALTSADALEKSATKALATVADIEKKIAEAEALPEPIDTAAIRVDLEHAKQVNAKLAARDRRTAIEADAIALEQQADALTKQIDARKHARAAAIAAAKMPVEGLGFADGIVTLNGIPFDQASSAEQLKVSFGIAKAANPTLRVISIKDASLLDENSLAQIAEMAKDGNYQVWLERVSTDRKVGVYIEDGTVVAVDGVPVAEGAAA